MEAGHLKVNVWAAQRAFVKRPTIELLKLLLTGKAGEWLKAVWPNLWLYKTSSWVVWMFSSEPDAAVTCPRDMSVLWRPLAPRRPPLKVSRASRRNTFLHWIISERSICLQCLTMASFGALLIVLPVALACAPQKAGDDSVVEDRSTNTFSFLCKGRVVKLGSQVVSR